MALPSKRIAIKDAMGPSGGLSAKDPEQGSGSWGLSKAAGVGSQAEGSQDRPVGVQPPPLPANPSTATPAINWVPNMPSLEGGGVKLSHFYR